MYSVAGDDSQRIRPQIVFFIVAYFPIVDIVVMTALTAAKSVVCVAAEFTQ